MIRCHTTYISLSESLLGPRNVLVLSEDGGPPHSYRGRTTRRDDSGTVRRMHAILDFDRRRLLFDLALGSLLIAISFLTAISLDISERPGYQ